LLCIVSKKHQKGLNKFRQGHTYENSRVRFNWTKAMIGDGISGGTGMIGVAVIGAFGGPIGWIALVSVAANAAVGSGIIGCL
jgi:uncharacterized protein YaaW (UPF0174 family)